MLKATVTDKLVAVAFILNKKRIPFQVPSRYTGMV